MGSQKPRATLRWEIDAAHEVLKVWLGAQAKKAEFVASPTSLNGLIFAEVERHRKSTFHPP